MYNQVPIEMKEQKKWLCWKKQPVAGGRYGKAPVNPKNGLICSKKDESLWVTFEEAISAVKDHDLDGIGFVFTDDFVAIDLDNCVNETTGEVNPIAEEILEKFNSYAEWSPSGTGVHVFCRGTKNTDRVKNTEYGIEVYGNGYHFVTVTGDILDPEYSLCLNEQPSLDWLTETYLPPRDNDIVPEEVAEVEEIAHGEKTPAEWLATGLENDPAFYELYHGKRPNRNESSDDYALLGKLAYWLNRDVDAIYAAFCESPHYLSKDANHREKIQRKDYLSNSINNVLRGNSRTAASDRTRTTNRLFKLEIEEGGEFFLTDFTDMGNANIMASVYKDILRYVPAWGWCYYDGEVWLRDKDHVAMDCAKAIVDGIYEAADNYYKIMMKQVEDSGIELNSPTGKEMMAFPNALLAHAKKSRMLPRIKAMVELNQSTMYSHHSEFDFNPMLFNTEGGVVNLESGELLPHDPSYKCTNISPFFIDSEQPIPMFEKFLNDIFVGDKELIDYMQMQLGSAMIGKVYTENLVLSYGTGSNGKSTLFNLMHTLFGSYATAVDAELIMSRSASEQQLGMSLLMGKRLAIAQETEEGSILSAAMLKRLCSTDTQIAKKLYRDPMEFIPTHTLFLATNHLPRVKSVDNGTWRRISLVPFNAHIKEKDMISDLSLKLIENEGAGIMNWLVEGAKKFVANSFKVEKPQAIIEAVNNYRMGEDWLSRFVDETCVINHNANDDVYVTHSELYAVYGRWAQMNGLRPQSSITFSKNMQLAGYVNGKKRVNDKVVTVWYDIELRAESAAGAMSVIDGYKKAL